MNFFKINNNLTAKQKIYVQFWRSVFAIAFFVAMGWRPLLNLHEVYANYVVNPVVQAALDKYQKYGKDTLSDEEVNLVYDHINRVSPNISTQLGALFPIAIASILFLKFSTSILEKISLSRKDCPYCAESIKKEAIVCKHCHKELI